MKNEAVPQSLSQTAGRAGGFSSFAPRLFLDIVLFGGSLYGLVWLLWAAF